MFVLVGDRSQTMTVHTTLLCFYSSCVLRRLNTDNNCPHHILVFLYGCVEKRLNTGNNCSHHILVFLYICVGMRLNTDNYCPYHIVLFLYDDCCVGSRLDTNVTLCPGQTLSPPVISEWKLGTGITDNCLESWHTVGLVKQWGGTAHGDPFVSVTPGSFAMLV